MKSLVIASILSVTLFGCDNHDQHHSVKNASTVSECSQEHLETLDSIKEKMKKIENLSIEELTEFYEFVENNEGPFYFAGCGSQLEELIKIGRQIKKSIVEREVPVTSYEEIVDFKQNDLVVSFTVLSTGCTSKSSYNIEISDNNKFGLIRVAPRCELPFSTPVEFEYTRMELQEKLGDTALTITEVENFNSEN